MAELTIGGKTMPPVKSMTITAEKIWSKNTGLHAVLRMALMTSLGLSIILVAFIYLCAPQVTAVFNGEHNATLAVYAEKGLRLYFLGCFFAGINLLFMGMIGE